MSKLNFSSIMLGSMQPKVLAEFYEEVFQKKADWTDGNYFQLMPPWEDMSTKN